MNYLNVPPMEILVIFRILTKSVTTTSAENAAFNFTTQTRIVFSIFAFYLYPLHKISLRKYWVCSKLDLSVYGRGKH